MQNRADRQLRTTPNRIRHWKTLGHASCVRFHSAFLFRALSIGPPVAGGFIAVDDPGDPGVGPDLLTHRTSWPHREKEPQRDEV